MELYARDVTIYFFPSFSQSPLGVEIQKKIDALNRSKLTLVLRVSIFKVWVRFQSLLVKQKYPYSFTFALSKSEKPEKLR